MRLPLGFQLFFVPFIAVCHCLRYAMTMPVAPLLEALPLRAA